MNDEEPEEIDWAGVLGISPPGSGGEPPAEGYWAVVEPIWDAIDTTEEPGVFLEQFGRVEPYRGHLYAVHWCVSEVCNGGFHQFFSNPTGVLAPEAVAGFRAIGLEECARLVEEAMASFGAPYPRERQRRAELLPNVTESPREGWDPFCKLDERFYELLESDGFDCAANEYARRSAPTSRGDEPTPAGDN